MHLLRLSISKDATMARASAYTTLARIVSQDSLDAVFPPVRSKSDAVRAACAYELLRWRRFESDGFECQALAASPKSATARGLNIHVHVKMRDSRRVQYSTLVARITAGRNGTPETTREAGAAQFSALASVLTAQVLEEQGQRTLYDADIRRLIQGLLEPSMLSLWPGVWLVLDEAGSAATAALERALKPLLTAGSLMFRLIALDMSQANREALAREIADELTPALEKLTERCGYDAPNGPGIQADYDKLCAKLLHAELLLGVEIPCLEAQLETEQALMAIA